MIFDNKPECLERKVKRRKSNIAIRIRMKEISLHEYLIDNRYIFYNIHYQQNSEQVLKEYLLFQRGAKYQE